MHIAFAASECVPFAKTGGLADVIGALPAEVARLGHRVTLYLPRYRGMLEQVDSPKVVIPSLTIPFASYNRFVTVIDAGVRDGVQLYFLDCAELFDREGLYGTAAGEYPDNAERFGLFARAVLEASKVLGVPDVFHVHDWQASLVPVYLRTTYYFDPVLRKVPCVLTVHNAGYQGWFPPTTTELLLLPWEIFTMDRLEYYDKFDFLKGGAVYSDAITTVSPRYAEEIQTSEFGFGLETIFQRRAADLHGILNGVDYAEWNPATDHNIAAHYTPERLQGKRECRQDLLHAYGLDAVAETTPIVGIVSRLATQKGVDMIAEIAEPLAKEDMVLLVLGTGDHYYETLFQELAVKFPGKIVTRVMYDNVLAHKVEAGADMFLMPSRYEPCGLNQIYSLKYGTPPVVRATGGLEDTVEEWNAGAGTGTGFKFSGTNPLDLLAALRRAFTVFQDKKAWRQLMKNGMAQSYTWDKPAKEYVAVYEEVVKRRS
ncbi:MAG TPA: glycogen synthase GlgA [Acidobacteriaceae bacterium]|jgi:starch synthase|nr:glycogen synthase GlgA [Acidobacteriaceae bacterium]